MNDQSEVLAVVSTEGTVSREDFDRATKALEATRKQEQESAVQEGTSEESTPDKQA